METLDKMTLGQRIKFARKSAGLSQAEVGIACHVKGNTVSRWEDNIGKGPGPAQLLAIAKITGRSLDFFAAVDLSAPDPTTEDLLDKLKQKNQELTVALAEVDSLKAELKKYHNHDKVASPQVEYSSYPELSRVLNYPKLLKRVVSLIQEYEEDRGLTPPLKKPSQE